MTLDGLLAIIGIIFAIYALASPSQRQSINLFVPCWVVPGAVLVSYLILNGLDGREAWKVPVCPEVAFVLKILAFLFPVGAGIWAGWRWKKARLSAKTKTDGRFRDLLLTSLREGTFDEVVRIVRSNTKRLASVLTKETTGLLFDRHFVRALVAARSWVHLELLTQEAILEKLPDRCAAVDCTIRELFSADESPLRTVALAMDAGTKEERELIAVTFNKAKWYMDCRVGRTLLMSARELLYSGKVDDSYNRNDLLYIAEVDASSRRQCPLYLAERIMVNAVSTAIEQGVDVGCDAADLATLFLDIHEHSRYDVNVWDNPPDYCAESPTPFAYLLSEISDNLSWFSKETFRRAESGVNRPGEIAGQLGRSWAACLACVIKDPGHVSDDFRRGLVRQYFSFILETLQPVRDESNGPPHLSEWLKAFLGPVKERFRPNDHAALEILRNVANEMDQGDASVRDGMPWLWQELGLSSPPRPQC
ncbi:MAG: hypothetical protein IMZ62_09340 [Chloroflexi bacterium]|nr:hypothetical protein [Chloroflexota bacterium]